jgi:hypothetical protein
VQDLRIGVQPPGGERTPLGAIDEPTGVEDRYIDEQKTDRQGATVPLNDRPARLGRVLWGRL